MNLACFALLFQLQFLFLKEYPAEALAEEEVIITLQTMLKRLVFLNYDVFKVFHWDWDLQNLLTQSTKFTINHYFKSNSRCGQFVSANNTSLCHQGNSYTIRLLYHVSLSYE